MQALFCEPDCFSSGLTVEFASKGYRIFSNSEALSKALEEAGWQEGDGQSGGMTLGMAFGFRHRALPMAAEDAAARLISLFDKVRIGFLFAIGWGEKAPFGLCVLERVLMRFGLNVSYAAAIASPDDCSSFKKIADDVADGRIRLAPHAFFAQRAANASFKRVQTRLSEIS